MRRNEGSPRLLCLYQHAPTPGAPGIYRHRLFLAELVRRGWHVDLISTPLNYMTGTVPSRYARKPYVRERLDGIETHWVWASGGIHASKLRRASNYVTFSALALARGATLTRPDVILVSSPPLTVGFLGPLLSARFKAPWLLEVRDIWPESAASVGWMTPTSRAYRALERGAHYLARDATAVVVPTPGLTDLVRAHGARHVEVVSGAVVDAAQPKETRDAVRKALGIGDDTCLFLYLGAVGVANGLDVILDAALQLRDDVPAELLIIGDGSARQRLAERLARERIGKVRILDPVPKDRVGDYLAASDVGLHILRPDPVFATALPSKVLEYFSARRPFITTVPGLPQKLAEESGGSFVATSGELAAEVRRWTELALSEREELGRRSFEYGFANFGFTRSVDRLERLLRSTMEDEMPPEPPSPSNQNQT
jgi:colanic acid biosynthesis glycosyl transferase WcaI